MKSRRQFAIREILQNSRIQTQEELCQALLDRGVQVTQATVSRDMKELGLLKVPDVTGYRYAFPDAQLMSTSQERLNRVLKELVREIDFSGNIVVIKTMPGAAQSVGSLIDSMNESRILGNVAGDDTVFIVVKPEDRAEEISRLLLARLAD